ncbi:MAG: glycosyltransferase [Dyella sp.]
MAQAPTTKTSDRRVRALSSKLHWRLKRLNYLRQRLLGSLALRGWHATLTRLSQEFQTRPALDESLTIDPLDVPFTPFALPVAEAPLVSVIIPIHGKLAYTLACLRTLARHGTRTPIEVIVVDDASPDESASVLAQIDGLRLLRNAHNLGFIGSCNAGAAAARGDYLLFLNNDTQVTPGWLDALLDCFASEADCGIAGSRLVYPDGRLQEAGCLVFADGSCWNVGRFEQRELPAYRYRRSVDYVSGASLMIRRQTFDQVGGFDTRYAPAYYEDTDLAFSVRALGLKVYYEPRSLVIHCEGISAGTHLDTGMKQYQKRNQGIFADKWASALRQQATPGTALTKALHQGQRGHILLVDSMTPDAQRDSGSLRLFGILKLLHQDGYQLSFAPDDGHAPNAQVEALGDLGVEVLARPWLQDIPHWLAEHGPELSAVILSRHTVAGQYAHLVRKHAPQATLIFDTVDLHFLREQRAAELTGQPAMQRQADASRRNELTLIEQADVSFVVSPHEQALLKQLAPHARVELLSNIHDVHGRRAPFEGRRDLVFIGGWGHPPNADAIRWIAEEILPALRAAIPDICVHILGDMPENVRQELRRPGLELHGRVPDLSPWMDRCLASIAPLRFGAGVKGKINMAMSYGLPVIATPLAVEGMFLKHGRDVLLAESPLETAAAVAQLSAQESYWLLISEASLLNIRQHFSIDAARRVLHAALGHS